MDSNNDPVSDISQGNSPKINFDTFQDSLIATFLFLLNEERHMAMYDYMRSTSYYAAFFWIMIITTGEVIVMKLFLALFINNYIETVNRDKILDEVDISDSESESDNEEEGFRVKVKKLVKSQWFENLILTLIIISCIIMAMDNPLDDPTSDLKIILFYLDLIITFFYAIEAILKIIAFGFIQFF